MGVPILMDCLTNFFNIVVSKEVREYIERPWSSPAWVFPFLWTALPISLIL
jgi:tryptophan-rich sensory protein